MDDSSGTLRYVSGSHLAGLRMHEWDWGPAGFAKNICPELRALFAVIVTLNCPCSQFGPLRRRLLRCR